MEKLEEIDSTEIVEKEGETIVGYKWLIYDVVNECYVSNWDSAIWENNSLIADKLPTEDNRNGIYSAKNSTSKILHGYFGSLNDDNSIETFFCIFDGCFKSPMEFEVRLVKLYLSGTIIESEYGYRAECADIVENIKTFYPVSFNETDKFLDIRTNKVYCSVKLTEKH